MPKLPGLDGYAFIARFYPAVITVFPLMSFVPVLWNSYDPRGLWPAGLAVGLPFFIASLVRTRGKKLEVRLVKRWGGLPTTQLLRHSDSRNPAVRKRRRLKIEALTGEALPTAKEERKDPEGSDDRYIAATRALLDRQHSEQGTIAILHAENVGYGFRRNMLALKSPALVIVTVCTIGDIWLFMHQQLTWSLSVVTVIHLAMFLVWALLVRQAWVLEAGNDYATALFGSLEAPNSS